MEKRAINESTRTATMEDSVLRNREKRSGRDGNDGPRTRKKRLPNPAAALLEYVQHSFVFANIECLVLLLEFSIAMVLLYQLALYCLGDAELGVMTVSLPRAVVEVASGLSLPIASSSHVELYIHGGKTPLVVLSRGLALVWMLLRYRSVLSFHKPRASRSVSGVMWFIIVTQGAALLRAHKRMHLVVEALPISNAWSVVVIEFVFCILFQAVMEDWLFTLENLVVTGRDQVVVRDGDDISLHVSLAFMARVLVITPVVEEMIFRWLALGLLLRRSSDQPLKCAFSCALLFGLFHLLNFSGTRFSATYIAMQIGFGIQVGFFYAMYMLMSGSVSQCILMHVSNNVMASLLPTQTDMDLIIQHPLMQMIRTLLFSFFMLCIKRCVRFILSSAVLVGVLSFSALSAYLLTAVKFKQE